MKTIIFCIALLCITGCDYIQIKKKPEVDKEKSAIELKLEPKK